MLLNRRMLSQKVNLEQELILSIMDKLAHASQKVGLASAMAVVLLIIILLVTFIQKAAFKYFFGEGEQEAIRTVRKR